MFRPATMAGSGAVKLLLRKALTVESSSRSPASSSAVVSCDSTASASAVRLMPRGDTSTSLEASSSALSLAAASALRAASARPASSAACSFCISGPSTSSAAAPDGVSAELGSSPPASCAFNISAALRLAVRSAMRFWTMLLLPPVIAWAAWALSASFLASSAAHCGLIGKPPGPDAAAGAAVTAAVPLALTWTYSLTGGALAWTERAERCCGVSRCSRSMRRRFSVRSWRSSAARGGARVRRRYERGGERDIDTEREDAPSRRLRKISSSRMASCSRMIWARSRRTLPCSVRYPPMRSRLLFQIVMSVSMAPSRISSDGRCGRKSFPTKKMRKTQSSRARSSEKGNEWVGADSSTARYSRRMPTSRKMNGLGTLGAPFGVRSASGFLTSPAGERRQRRQL